MTLSGTFAGNVSAADAHLEPVRRRRCLDPFIVDTVNNVVGIRGSLIVDGLIAADEAEFQNLTVTTGFIQHLSSEVMRADLVVANRLIAGVSEASSAGWRAELNKPGNPGDQANWRPFRYWDPSTGQVGFEVDGLGNTTVGRNLIVGANATIRSTGSHLTSIGAPAPMATMPCGSGRPSSTAPTAAGAARRTARSGSRPMAVPVSVAT